MTLDVERTWIVNEVRGTIHLTETSSLTGPFHLGDPRVLLARRHTLRGGVQEIGTNPKTTLVENETVRTVVVTGTRRQINPTRTPVRKCPCTVTRSQGAIRLYWTEALLQMWFIGPFSQRMPICPP